MFFCIKKDDFQLIQDMKIDSFPSKEVPDEFFWANQLIMKGNKVENSNFIFVNDDPTKTQALSWVIDSKLLHHARSQGHLFIRKVASFSDAQAKNYLRKLTN